jgi:hypothetical protein
MNFKPNSVVACNVAMTHQEEDELQEPFDDNFMDNVLHE